MKGLGSFNENKIQGKQSKVEKGNLVKFNCSKHTNGKSGTIRKKHYKKIFCLDNKMKLAEIYEILHNKNNFGKDVAFVLNSDLDFSKKKKAGGLDYVSLNNNLTLTKYETGQDTFLPIGGGQYFENSAGGKDEFNATFYGNNHKIIVGNIDYPDNNSVGFFGVIGEHGKVYDLQLQIGDINGKEYVGGFVGQNDEGTIENSSTVVNFVSGSDEDVGGFVGWNRGTITNSSTVVNSVRGDYKVGGFIGINDYGKILNSSAIVNTISGRKDVGGFIGRNKGGKIENSSTVVNSVECEKSNIGGFVGENNNGGKITNSSTVINSVSGKYDVGGFVGLNYSIIGDIPSEIDSINALGKKKNIGGFIGGNYNIKYESIIENSSAIVNTISGKKYVGSFVGGNIYGIYTNDVVRVLDSNSKVSAGYYTSKDLAGKSTKFNNQKFFFGNKKGLSYNGTSLKITVPAEKIFNKENFPSAFKTKNGKWGNTIKSNLKKYWTKWEK